MSVSIVIPVYNAVDYARRCVESVYQARTLLAFEVIVVNNGSDRGVRDWLADEQTRRADFRAMHFDEPLGFAKAVNEGARVARGSSLVVLNSDTVVTDGWLDALQAVLDDAPHVGVVGPVTNRCGHPIQADPEAEALTEADAAKFAAQIRDRGWVQEPQRLVFFCALIRRDLWERLAGLDESYRRGNFEDDDFCLRARMLGYRLAIARNCFVFHHESRTFDGNRLDHGETMARNQSLFCSRAGRWSRSAPLPTPHSELESDVVVIVPMTDDRAGGLTDSLAGLANQTVRGFSVIVVSTVEAEDHADRLPSLDIRFHRVTGDGRLPRLLNEGLRLAVGRPVTFLPAGDVYFPFHLEVMLQALRDGHAAAYSAWSLVDRERAGAVRPDQTAPNRLELGDWAPLVCWAFADAAEVPRFNESLLDWAGWEFVLRLRRTAKLRFLPRVTCQKATSPNRPSGEELRRVMDAFPSPEGAWQTQQRRHFLQAVEDGASKDGAWETALILERNEIERRARRLLAPADALVVDAREISSLRARLSRASACCSPHPAPPREAPDVLLFNIVGWTHLTQRPHHFARGLAAAGHRVFWVDVELQEPGLTDTATLLRELETNLFHVRLPAAAGEIYRLSWTHPVLEAMEEAVAFLALKLGVERAVQLVNFPKWTPLAHRLRGRFNWPVVYDCLDDQRAFGDLHRNNDAHLEDELVESAALVTTSGRTLFERVAAVRPDTLLLPNAADYALFAGAAEAGLLAHLPRPVAGFFGAFSEWLDRGWIAEAARRFPHWSFVYIGREGFARPSSRKAWRAATSAPNITVLPQAPLEILAQYLAEFDVCTMPFRDLPITRSMNAVKIYEYLAAGKSVVASELPETRPLAERGLLSVYRDWDHSFELLREAYETRDRLDLVRARRKFAAENTWARRTGELSAALSRLAAPVKDLPKTLEPR